MTTKFLFRSRYRCAAEFKDCLKFTIHEYFFGLKYLLHIFENLEVLNSVLIFKIMSHLIRLGEGIYKELSYGSLGEFFRDELNEEKIVAKLK